MRLLRHASAAGSLLLIVCSIGRAGVYNPAEMGKTLEPTVTTQGVKPLPFDPNFRLAVDELLEIPDDVRNTKRRQHYLAQVEALRAKVDNDPDNVTDRVSLSAYHIRLGQPDKAILTLESVARGKGRNHFMVNANLATAYQMFGDPQSLQRADDYMQQTLSRPVWPKEWPGLSAEQLAWYRRAEEMQLKLIRARRKELATHGGKGQPVEAVDNLFGVKYVGADGAYEAGSIAPDEKKKLPPDALALMEMLVLWLPTDSQLYWQLGEVLNAEGKPSEAREVLSQCGWSRGLNAAELRSHRQILDEALAPPPEPSWLPERNRLIAISAGSGLLVLLLLGLQFRELAKRWGWFG